MFQVHNGQVFLSLSLLLEPCHTYERVQSYLVANPKEWSSRVTNTLLHDAPTVGGP